MVPRNPSEVIPMDSQGLKQRLAIAQALMEKPSLLVLDETLNAIDNKSVAYFRRFF